MGVRRHAVGIVGAVALLRLLGTPLYDVTPTEPIVLALRRTEPRHAPIVLRCGSKATEPALLAGIQAELLHPETVSYVTERLTKALEAISDQRPAQLEAATHQRETLRGKIGNLVAAIESGTGTPTILRALQEREAVHPARHRDRGSVQPADDRKLAVLPSWLKTQLADVASVLYDAPERAGTNLGNNMLD